MRSKNNVSLDEFARLSREQHMSYGKLQVQETIRKQKELEEREARKNGGKKN